MKKLDNAIFIYIENNFSHLQTLGLKRIKSNCIFFFPNAQNHPVCLYQFIRFFPESFGA